MKLCQFKVKMLPYMVGETAGLEDRIANQLAQSGFVVILRDLDRIPVASPKVVALDAPPADRMIRRDGRIFGPGAKGPRTVTKGAGR